jgi:hypothetical protein
MTSNASILVLTSCTASKSSEAVHGPVPAEQLYTGQQHRRLMQGIHHYRAAGEPAGPLDLHIVSAGHGVLPGHQPVSTYDETFVGLTRHEVVSRAQALRIPDTVRELLARPRRLALVLLGEDYLRACALDGGVLLGAPTLAFTSPNAGARLPEMDRLRTVALHNREARRFRCGLIGLKGELAGRLLRQLAQDPEDMPSLEDTDLLSWLELERTTDRASVPAHRTLAAA